MALAGLWENWRSPAGERIGSFAIVTTPAERIMRGAAQPDARGIETGRLALVARRAADRAGAGQGAADPYPSDGMIAWPVSPRVGNVKNNDPSLIEPVVLPKVRRCG
jgi:putative SOS response-associated peptidase YedK